MDDLATGGRTNLTISSSGAAVALAQDPYNRAQAQFILQSAANKKQYLYIVYDFDEQQIKSSVRLTTPQAMAGASTLSGLFRMDDPKSLKAKLALLTSGGASDETKPFWLLEDENDFNDSRASF